MKRPILAALFIALLYSFHPAEKTWVAIGDSITYLNDHKDETGNRVTKGYLTGVTEKISGLKYINQGHNGWTAVRIATEIDKLGITKADLYTIFLGTNDWWGGKPVGTIADYENNTGANTVNGAFRIIIDELRSLNKEAKIILITPMQRVDFVYINNFKNNAYGSYRDKNGQQLSQVTDAILDIGKKEGFAVVDLYHNKKLALPKLVKFKRLKDPKSGAYRNYPYPAFIDIPFNPEADEYPYPVDAIQMTYDGLHPSDAGYAVITEAVAKAIRRG
ncbi:MAG: SGNH/GDSL hydrolase family protein [Chitinophagaceae bacterium]|nr:SGNH/GDSL hydrolase family protein [Chitinophagaceae bacterium]